MATEHSPAHADVAKTVLEAIRTRVGARDAALSAEIDRALLALDTLSLENTSLLSKVSAMTDRTEREIQKALMLTRVSSIVNSSLDLDHVLKDVLDAAVEVMKADRGFVVLQDDAGKFAVAIAHNINPDDPNDAKISQSIVRKVFESGEPVFTTDAQTDPRFEASQSIQTLALRSIICVPLKLRDVSIGVVYLDSRITPNLFHRGDPQLILAFAHQAALAIDNARLFKEQAARLAEISRLEAFQTQILESITSGVVTTDRAGTITTFNEAAGTTFGVVPASMVGITTFLGLGHNFGGHYNMVGRHATRGDLALEVRIAPLEKGDLPGGVAIAVTDMTERRALEELHQQDIKRSHAVQEAISRYLAPHVVESLMRHPEKIRLGGERQPATIMFADIRDFTKMASHMPAEQVVDILNTYLDEAVATIFRYEGLLDKFYGDGIMAVFGPPKVRGDDATRAIKAAVELNDIVGRLESKIGRPLHISVGLATGDVVAGHIGSAKRMDYTVIGDAVNLASRLQAAAPADAIFVDEPTYLASKLNYPADKMIAKIRGRDDEITIYQLKIT
jgi:adenylate cyclase